MRIARLFAALAATCSFAVPAAAQDASTVEPEDAPGLVVLISVDQLSADLFAQYRGHFSGGMGKLMQGAVFPSAFQSHAATETCPGHATIGTGVRPARSGIIANWWYAPGSVRADKRIYCAEDETDPESTAMAPVSSPRHLKVPTLAEWVKKANPLSRNVAVSGKDRGALMLGGRDTDGVFWWSKQGFTTLKGREAPDFVAGYNREIARGTAIGGQLPSPEWCDARSRSVRVGDLTIGDTRFPRPRTLDDRAWASPWVDMATVGLAVRMIDEYNLGEDDAPDVLSVSLSATDSIGHAYGSEGAEMCVQMAQLDRSIAMLLRELDRRGIDYVVALSADHGGIDAPERLEQQGYPRAVRAAPELETAALAAMVSKATGIVPTSGPLLMGSGGSGDIYFSAELTSEQKARVGKVLVDWLNRHPQVAEAYTAQQLADAPLPSGSPQDWTLLERARASFDPRRSGDVVVLLERAVVPVSPRAGYVTSHGSPWDYDRRVPLLFWRKGINGFEQPAPVETVDIAPTLASLIGLHVPDTTFDGRCLDIDGGPRNTCGQ